MSAILPLPVGNAAKWEKDSRCREARPAPLSSGISSCTDAMHTSRHGADSQRTENSRHTYMNMNR
jgi:hypothetical protein